MSFIRWFFISNRTVFCYLFMVGIINMMHQHEWGVKLGLYLIPLPRKYVYLILLVYFSKHACFGMRQNQRYFILLLNSWFITV